MKKELNCKKRQMVLMYNKLIKYGSQFYFISLCEECEANFYTVVVLEIVIQGEECEATFDKYALFSIQLAV